MSKLLSLDVEPPKDRRARAVIYIRVSTMSQVHTDFTDDGLSLAAQRSDCLRTCEDELNADVAEIFVDRGESARTTNRPDLQRMLRFLTEDEDVDYVVIHKLDRLSRSVEDAVAIRMAIRKAGAQLVSASEKIDDTPSGRLVTNIMTDVASFYSDNLAVEALKGMRQKHTLGGTNHRAPIGYLNVIKNFDGKPVRTIEVDPERAPHIKWAFERFAEGDMTVDLLMEALEARGLKTRGTRSTPANRFVVPACTTCCAILITSGSSPSKACSTQVGMNVSSPMRCSSRCKTCWPPSASGVNDHNAAPTI
jgi:site-specific DNA recombinase